MGWSSYCEFHVHVNDATAAMAILIQAIGDFGEEHAHRDGQHVIRYEAAYIGGHFGAEALKEAGITFEFLGEDEYGYQHSVFNHDGLCIDTCNDGSGHPTFSAPDDLELSPAWLEEVKDKCAHIKRVRAAIGRRPSAPYTRLDLTGPY